MFCQLTQLNIGSIFSFLGYSFFFLLLTHKNQAFGTIFTTFTSIPNCSTQFCTTLHCLIKLDSDIPSLHTDVNYTSPCCQNTTHNFQSCTLLHIQWVRKVFRPLQIFHSLLYCSHLLKSINFIFFLVHAHTAPNIVRKTQTCRHFCRFITK